MNGRYPATGSAAPLASRSHRHGGHRGPTVAIACGVGEGIGRIPVVGIGILVAALDPIVDGRNHALGTD